MLERDLTKYLREHPAAFSRVLEQLLSTNDTAALFAARPKRERDYDEMGNPFVKKKKARTVPAEETPEGELFSVADMRSEIEDRIIARIASDPERFLDIFMLALVSKNINREIQTKLRRLETEIDVVPQYCRAAFLYYEDKETHELFYDKVDRYAPATAAAWQLLSDSEELTEKFDALYTMMKRDKPAYFDLALLNNAEDPLAALICLHFSAGFDSPFSRGDIKWLLERTVDWDLALFLQPRKANEGLEWIKNLIVDGKSLATPLGDDARPIRWQVANTVRYFRYCARYLLMVRGTLTDFMAMLKLPDLAPFRHKPENEEAWRVCFQLDEELLWDLMTWLDGHRKFVHESDIESILYFCFKFSFEKMQLRPTETIRMMRVIKAAIKEHERVMNNPSALSVLRYVFLDMGCPLHAFEDMHQLLNETGWFTDIIGWDTEFNEWPRNLFYSEIVSRGRFDLLRVLVRNLQNLSLIHI